MEVDTPDQVLTKFRHDINCLSDSNRAIRKSGLDKLTKELLLVKNKDSLHQLISQYLINPLIKCLSDPIEKHREMTINLFQNLIKALDFDKVLLSIIITEIISRMDHTPFPETSEEMRIKLIKLLETILEKNSEELKPQISSLCKMIAILLKDPCPDLKIELSKFITNLTLKHKEDIGPYSKGIADSLCLNLKHQHNKIRKITTNSLVDLLLCNEAGNCFNDCFSFLKPLANDKNTDVRKNFYTSIAKLLNNFNIVYLRKSEANLVMLLLNGLSDEKEDIRKLVGDLLEECGNNRKKLATELGEDISKFI